MQNALVIFTRQAKTWRFGSRSGRWVLGCATLPTLATQDYYSHFLPIFCADEAL